MPLSGVMFYKCNSRNSPQSVSVAVNASEQSHRWLLAYILCTRQILAALYLRITVVIKRPITASSDINNVHLYL